MPLAAGYEAGLIRGGLALFLAGLLQGVLIPAFRNPRIAVSAHVGALVGGLFLAALGLAGSRMRLSARAGGVLYLSAQYGAWGTWASNVLAAVLGTSRLTPMAGAGFSGSTAQELLVSAGLVSAAIAMIVACGLALRGLRGVPDRD